MPLSRAHRVLMLLLSPDHASPLSHLSVPLAGPHASPAGLPTGVSGRSGGGKVRRNSSYAQKQWCKTELSAAMRWAPGAQFFGPATGVLHHRRTGIGVARRRSSGGSLVPLVGGGALRAGCPPKAVGRRGAASAQYAQTQTQRSAKKGRCGGNVAAAVAEPSPLPAGKARVQAGGVVQPDRNLTRQAPARWHAASRCAADSVALAAAAQTDDIADIAAALAEQAEDRPARPRAGAADRPDRAWRSRGKATPSSTSSWSR